MQHISCWPRFGRTACESVHNKAPRRVNMQPGKRAPVQTEQAADSKPCLTTTHLVTMLCLRCSSPSATSLLSTCSQPPSSCSSSGCNPGTACLLYCSSSSRGVQSAAAAAAAVNSLLVLCCCSSDRILQLTVPTLFCRTCSITAAAVARLLTMSVLARLQRSCRAAFTAGCCEASATETTLHSRP